MWSHRLRQQACPFSNLDNGEPNSNTHAYGHYSLTNDVYAQEAEEHVAASNDLKIVSREKKVEARLQKKYALAIKRAKRTQPDDILDDKVVEVQVEDFILAQQAAVACPGTRYASTL